VPIGILDDNDAKKDKNSGHGKDFVKEGPLCCNNMGGIGSKFVVEILDMASA
jgi:hypothetical protein